MTITDWISVIISASLLVAYHIVEDRHRLARKRCIDAIIAESRLRSAESDRKLGECKAFCEGIKWRTTFRSKRGQA